MCEFIQGFCQACGQRVMAGLVDNLYIGYRCPQCGPISENQVIVTGEGINTEFHIDKGHE